jgi:glycerophosphoryl diester phosphodiesterase
MHDPTLRPGCAPFTGHALHTLTAAQLGRVRCGGQPVPRLTELVARLSRPDAARVSVMAEVKDTDPLGVRDALAPLGRRRVLVQSFDFDALRQIEHATPSVRTCPLFWNADSLDAALHVTRDCVAPDWRAVTPALVTRAHAAGAIVLPFTIDDPAQMIQLAGAGVDGIITNRPRLARTTLAGWTPTGSTGQLEIRDLRNESADRLR